MRESSIRRSTGETEITLQLCLDGQGKHDIHSGVGFLDHMLTLFAVHGGFDLTVRCQGDTEVDDHHSVEDIAICLGQAFREALGDKKGIARYGDITLPMDEALILAAVDISGRGQAHCQLELEKRMIGSFDAELVEEFFIALAANGGITLHLRQLAGKNGHHIAEGAFKACARALGKAVALTGGGIPSTKGVL